jgi:hypothetical protein
MAGNEYASIGGGANNTNLSAAGTIAGGQNNLILQTTTTVYQGAIGGGYGNTVSNSYATIPGGGQNLAGGFCSFAAGQMGQALHDGAFVWADATATPLPSTNNNSVTMRASGGYRLYSGPSSGVFLGPGDPSWATISDKNSKKNFAPVDGQSILQKLAAVPIQRWNYKWEADTNPPHIGPMAQDFKAAFYPGRDDKSITTLEFDGVELAAIQGLNQELRAKDAQIQTQSARITDLEARLTKLEQVITALSVNSPK